MPESSPEATLIAGYDAFNRRDAVELRRLMVPGFKWNEAEEVPGRKLCENADEFMEYMMGFDVLWESFSFEPVDFARVRDDTVVARVVGRGRGRSGGEPVEIEIHHVWRFDSEKVARMDAFFDPREAADVAQGEPRV